MRVLCVDPGEKRFGIAISDPTGTIANPLAIIKHVSRNVDVAAILDLVQQHDAQRIIIGQAMDSEGMPSQQGRRAIRLAEAIRSQTDLDVILWDESGSTQSAREARIALGVKKRKRQDHIDDLAATVILQSYLDSYELNSG